MTCSVLEAVQKPAPKVADLYICPGSTNDNGPGSLFKVLLVKTKRWCTHSLAGLHSAPKLDLISSLSWSRYPPSLEATREDLEYASVPQAW